MIKNAKVSLAAVRTFRSSVKDVSVNSEKFTRGITCLEQMREELSKAAQELRDKLEAMQSAQDILQEKINSIEEIINELQAQIDALEIEVSSLESELSATRPSFTVPGPDGEIDIPNPKYAALEAKISVKEGAIGALRTKMLPHQRRLEKARLIEYKLSMHMEKLRGNIYSLEEKKLLCKQLVSELTEAKKSNSTWCMNAIEGLTNIERVVNSYVRTKMKYDTAAQSAMQQNSNRLNGINITININKPNRVVGANSEEQTESLRNRYSQEEIDEHRIRFDEFNRICEYDGRKYGGKYIPYEDRLKKSMADNPVLGRYVGERGESKYMPSNRSVEGIIVQQILGARGLDGIVYRNAEPEFETCADAVVKIKAMTGNRLQPAPVRRQGLEPGERCRRRCIRRTRLRLGRQRQG